MMTPHSFSLRIVRSLATALTLATCAPLYAADCSQEQDDHARFECEALEMFVSDYGVRIKQKVMDVWEMPKDVPPQTQVVVKISLDAVGNVVGTSVATPSSYETLDSSAQQAVAAASPLPIPLTPEHGAFFRELELMFTTF